MICPNCGAVVAEGALSYRECGSDSSTGWSKAAEYAHILPDEDGLRVPKRRWKMHGIGIVCSLVMTGVLWGSGVRWALWIGVLAVIGFVLFTRFRGEGSEHALFAQLVARCRDRELAERLIEAERKRAPDASRQELIRKALLRLSRDRR
jgi:hypothetical protein